MRLNSLVGLAIAVLLALSSQNARLEAQNAPAMSIQQVKTVFHRRAVGNTVFTARLRAELEQEGLRFVANSREADAILDTSGQATARGFAGKMTFFDRRGRVLWSQNVFRPDNSRVMAYRRLADQLRARRQNSR
jgi:predicted membrane metal-binding protein